ncbi:hypothetical protein GIB67_023507 [Kingdonia uniflora]|uniref:Disease resistance R13L4/SHOC-2-like LRR domain-containing protein n=1 Tax=Kingdonia uniflora TaxID=39325 RepID=A0A7J7P9Y4_9MAGN|nr:hypothetical protein GIB67_023507 [Kingdonia uniflora]
MCGGFFFFATSRAYDIPVVFSMPEISFGGNTILKRFPEEDLDSVRFNREEAVVFLSPSKRIFSLEFTKRQSEDDFRYILVVRRSDDIFLPRSLKEADEVSHSSSRPIFWGRPTRLSISDSWDLRLKPATVYTFSIANMPDKFWPYFISSGDNAFPNLGVNGPRSSPIWTASEFPLTSFKVVLISYLAEIKLDCGYIMIGISFSLALLSGTFGNQLLDEWHTRSLKSKSVRIDDASTGKKEVWSYLQCQCSCLNKLSLHHDVGHRIKVFKKRLDVIASEKDKYKFELEELPETVSNLCNLQTLKLNHCLYLRRLPEGMGKLVNLRHLEIEETDGLEYLPQGIGRLKSLQTLCKFIVSEGCKLRELKYLKNLHGSLDITNIKGKGNEYDEAELKNKEYLKLKTLPPLGKLESLRHLKIHKLDSVKPIDLEVLGISYDGQECGTAEAPELIYFPKLKELEVSFMSWENWVMRRGNIIPSCLVSEDWKLMNVAI